MLNDENSMTASGSAQSESTTELPNTGTVPEKSATRRHRAATRAAGAPAESSAGESSASVPVTTAAGSGGAVVTSAAETVDLPRPPAGRRRSTRSAAAAEQASKEDANATVKDFQPAVSAPAEAQEQLPVQPVSDHESGSGDSTADDLPDGELGGEQSESTSATSDESSTSETEKSAPTRRARRHSTSRSRSRGTGSRAMTTASPQDDVATPEQTGSADAEEHVTTGTGSETTPATEADDLPRPPAGRRASRSASAAHEKTSTRARNKDTAVEETDSGAPESSPDTSSSTDSRQTTSEESTPARRTRRRRSANRRVSEPKAESDFADIDAALAKAEEQAQSRKTAEQGVDAEQRSTSDILDNLAAEIGGEGEDGSARRTTRRRAARPSSSSRGTDSSRGTERVRKADRRSDAHDAEDHEDSAAAEHQSTGKMTSSTEDSSQTTESGEGTTRRRRRRGGRRRHPTEAESGADNSSSDKGNEENRSSDDGSEKSSSEPTKSNDADRSDHEGGSTRRRRRRRRRGEDTSGSDDDPNNVVIKVREPRSRRSVSDEVSRIEGSTRVEAKKQRRREGRAAGRRRNVVLTEAEFLARRESVDRKMVIRQSEEYSQLAVLEDGVLVEHYVDRASATSAIGNVYLGKVQSVLPSMEAAFVDIGRRRNAVIYAGEIEWEKYGEVGKEHRIEQVLKTGDPILVQVTKDPVGAKGARLTSHISLPGRYVVYSPDGKLSGISRKLFDSERKRLRKIVDATMPSEASVIVRTAAEGVSEEDLTRDINRLKAQWEVIERKAGTSHAPQMLYSEPDLTVRIIRDLFNEDFSELIVAGNGGSDDAYETIKAYVDHVAPSLEKRLTKWDTQSQGDLFQKYRIDEQVAKGLERKVFLPSGGSLVIDRTEAMTVIDVNTGKFTGSAGNLEATVTANNLEAAEEIVRQLRLRDIGGIIVIDFIDMVLPANRELLVRRLIECLGRDRTRHQVSEVTSLGLVQMTRKKIGTGLAEAFTEECSSCGGRGYVRHDKPVNSQAPADGGERSARGRRTSGGRKSSKRKSQRKNHEN